MALITIEDLREEFPFVIHEDILDKQLTRSIASASKRLKQWISEVVYQEVVAEIDGLGEGVEPTDERILILQNAEGHLALHYALLGLNTNLRNFGLVKREQVESNTINEYFSPNDVDNFSMQYLEKAREIAESYLLADGTPTTGFESASFE